MCENEIFYFASWKWKRSNYNNSFIVFGFKLIIILRVVTDGTPYHGMIVFETELV